jgi:hypothetical protein
MTVKTGGVILNYQIMLKNELEGLYKANAETKSNKGISGELRVLAEKIRQSTKADGEEMKQKKLASITTVYPFR